MVPRGNGREPESAGGIQSRQGQRDQCVQGAGNESSERQGEPQAGRRDAAAVAPIGMKSPGAIEQAAEPKGFELMGPRTRWARMLLLLAGILFGQVVLYGPSLLGRKIL